MMMILPIMGLLAALSVFAAIFFCIRWLVKHQWYSILSVVTAHIILGYSHRFGWLQWEFSKDRLLLLMTLICSMLILVKWSVLIGNKKKKRTV
ncbi:hypothetical protein SAMN05421663_103363 [Terribacillus halophilus]|uniref:Uncharacterized protein n=1 Tax=Terribacillus halophilus TaxID=361279 RepID=A0A1G6NP53_9BACI|nr:hypothetical protein [Terribacillus halophilus]SDC69056.1 hypothetical protein SAMN05421663_103363 [Terribacillus halophilus]